MNIEKAKNNNKELIELAINKYLLKIDNDYEHDINHTYDVVNYVEKLLNKIKDNEDIDVEVCIIAAYWHDVGRSICNIGHEEVSAKLLKEEMIKLSYNEEMINKCYLAVINHKWDDNPKTKEGIIVKDADKIAFLGSGRWTSCLDNNQNLDEIIKLLPDLRNKYLYFNESKEIYDKEIVKILEFVYKRLELK